MNIPIVICNRDRLSTLRNLIDDLVLLYYTNIFVLDNQSTYQPLLDYYKDCPAEIIYLENIGHQALWKSGVMSRFADHEFIVYTDSDIELNEHVLPGFIEQMIIVAKDYRIDKVGCALRITDLPDNSYCSKIISIESQYWRQKLQHAIYEVYSAPVDTTFCIVKPNKPFQYEAIRIAGNFTARHIPWYNTWDNLSEEEQYYVTHADRNIASFKQLLDIA